MASEPAFGGHPLAHRDGIAFVMALLFASGAMCPECGFGTRVTSKNWAKCKRCGTRVRRVSVEEAAERIEARLLERAGPTPTHSEVQS